MYLPNFQSVALPVPELIGGSQKIGAVPSYAHTVSIPPPKKKSYMPTIHYRLFIYVHSFYRDFRLQFCGGCEPPIVGKGRPYGVGDGTVRKSVGEFL